MFVVAGTERDFWKPKGGQSQFLNIYIYIYMCIYIYIFVVVIVVVVMGCTWGV